MTHKFIKLLLLIPIAGALLQACNDDESNWEKYTAWRTANTEYFDQLRFEFDENGKNFYTTLVPSWNPAANVLIRYFNDRSLTQGNLSPMLTSTVRVKYIGRLYNGVAFDSSYTATASYGDSLLSSQPSQLIQGWQIALMDMRVGDSARVVIPYSLGYGYAGSGVIPPYSTLVFDMKLVDIPDYEIR